MTYRTKFIIDGIIYFESSLNGVVSYTKMVNGKEVPVSSEELLDLKNNSNSYISYFIADYYLSKNNRIDIVEKRLIRPVLREVEKLIPIPYREDFYNNLKTLKIVFEEESNEPNAHFKIDESEKKNHVVALYNNRNTLLVNKTYFKDFVLKNDDQDTIYTFKSIIFHELKHMSSTKYNQDGKGLGFGFWSGLNGNGNNTIEYIGLIEGYTQLLTSICYPEEISKTNYSITSLLMYQLMQIVGKDVLDVSYYKEHNTISIINELCKYIPDVSLAKYLLDTIEKVYQATFSNRDTFCLHEAQYVMERYFATKVNQMQLKGMNEDKVLAKIDKYRKSLITEEKLEFLKADPSKYLGIEYTLEEFDKMMSAPVPEPNSSHKL